MATDLRSLGNPGLWRLVVRGVTGVVLALVAAGCTGTATDASPAIFRVDPVRPVGQLRREALAAKPPAESGKLDPDLVEIRSLDATVRLDIRYATTANFLSTKVYDEARAYLQRPAAAAVVRAHRALAGTGHGLLIHDAYRPWYVTKIFWDATPPLDKREFVADPEGGSRHNRGCAVDLTLYELESGRAVEMPSLYDEMSERSYPTYTGGTPEQTRLRELLRAAMEAEGFTVYEAEWWHFDYKDWESYPIGNETFDKLR
ncbi:MAG: M15 family metallopeptidase [Acidobacteriota bacterium]|nr:M15 family metallopeptidase [Acidobacteriota bacterium]